MQTPPLLAEGLRALFAAAGLGCALGCQDPANTWRRVADNARAEVVPLLARRQEQTPRPRLTSLGPAARLSVVNQRACPMPAHVPVPAGWSVRSVQIELEALAEAQVAVNRVYGELIDRDGRSYQARLEGCAPVLGASPLGQGKLARGWLNFVVPETALELEVVYAPRLSDGTVAEGLRVRLR
jgi:hypothetical protein